MIYKNKKHNITFHLPSNNTLSKESYGILLLNPKTEGSSNPTLVSFPYEGNSISFHSTKELALANIKQLKAQWPEAHYQLIQYKTKQR